MKNLLLQKAFSSNEHFNIILVEDDEIVLELIKDIFSDNKNISIFPFNNSEDALIEFENNQNYHLCIVDYFLPGKNGLEFIKSIREINSDIPCIMITAQGSIQLLVDIINSNIVYKIILKPWQNQEFIDTVYDALEFYLMKRFIKEYTEDIENKNIILEELYIRMESIIANITDGMIVIFPDGKINMITKIAERLITNKSKKINYTGISIFDTEIEDYIKQRIFYFINNKDIENERFDWNINNNTFTIKMSKFKNKNNKVLGIIINFVDITKERELDKLKQDFVSNVSHELRTPLSSIQGFSEVLINSPDFPEEKKINFLKIIYKEATRLSEMVNSILSLSKIEALDKKPELVYFDAIPLVKDVFLMLENKAKAKFIDIDISYTDPSIEVKSEKGMLKEILINLLDNAIKYTQKYGKVEIKISNHQDKKFISIKDDGPGIPEEEQSNIFKKFYRLKKDSESKGSGLGLSIVKALAEKCDISLTLKSKEGEGTEFILYFPE